MNRQIAPYTENILDAPLNEPVCWCSKVSKQMILEAIKNGANNIGSIRQTTEACTVGRCKLLSPRERCCSKEILLLLDADVSA